MQAYVSQCLGNYIPCQTIGCFSKPSEVAASVLQKSNALISTCEMTRLPDHRDATILSTTRKLIYINRCYSLLVGLFFLHVAFLALCIYPGKRAPIMPRSGYSREDRVVRRSGYVSQDNNPVDRRGGPESHSGRINHTRMNERASPDTFLPSLNPRSCGPHIPHRQLYSSTASDLSKIAPRDDL